MTMLVDNIRLRNGRGIENDCAIRAVAIAMALPYPTVEALAYKEWDFLNGWGSDTLRLRYWLDTNPACKRILSHAWIDMADIEDIFPVGQFLFLVRGHIFAVSDGRLFDGCLRSDITFVVHNQFRSIQRVYAVDTKQKFDFIDNISI